MRAEESARPGNWRGSTAVERPRRSAPAQETKSERRRGHCGKNACGGGGRRKLIWSDVKFACRVKRSVCAPASKLR